MGLFGGGGHSNDNAPPNPQQKALKKISQAQWEDYKARFIPNENNYIEKVNSLKDETPLAISRAVAANAQGYGKAQRKAGMAAMAHGVNPNSGSYQMEQADLENLQSSTGARGGVSAVESAKQRYLSGLRKAVSYGRGLADDANLGFRQAAVRTAESTQREAAYNEAVKTNRWDAGGTVGGAALRTFMGMGGEQKPDLGSGYAGDPTGYKPSGDIQSDFDSGLYDWGNYKA